MFPGRLYYVLTEHNRNQSLTPYPFQMEQQPWVSPTSQQQPQIPPTQQQPQIPPTQQQSQYPPTTSTTRSRDRRPRDGRPRDGRPRDRRVGETERVRTPPRQRNPRNGPHPHRRPRNGDRRPDRPPRHRTGGSGRNDDGLVILMFIVGSDRARLRVSE